MPLRDEARLAHKRALDRKAQNAKRERTRLRIESLEQQLATCEGRLRDLEQENARLEAENGRLRECMASPSTVLESDDGLADDMSAPSPTLPVVPYVPLLDALAPVGPHLFQVLPCNAAPTCLSDEIMHTFLQSQRAAPLPPEARTEQPNVLSLLLPEHEMHMSPILRVTSDVLRAFTDISTLPEQVAGLSLMFRLLNWRVHPTLEHYKALPAWLRPIPVQLRIPHPAWMDAIPWPKVRAHLVSRQHDYDFDAWSAVYSAGLTVSWPYIPCDAVVAVSAAAVVASPVFEQHWQSLRNWNADAAFRRRYPEIGRLIDDR